MKPKEDRYNTGNHFVLALLVLLLAPLWIPALVLWLLFNLASLLWLHIAVWILWLPRHKRLLFVYSDSPIWQTYIETHILPRIREQAVILNWSERQKWSKRHMLAVAVFRQFGGRRDFNPMAVVFRPLTLGRVFRFFQPFRDLKHGKPELLARVETEFFRHLRLNELQSKA